LVGSDTPPRADESGRRGVLLVNLGSPDAPDSAAVRRYLNEFLMDPFVIDSPWLVRRLVVSCFILPFRPRRSAKAYRSIWRKNGTGAPLLAHSEALHAALTRQSNAPVSLAMRYGSPSIEAGVAELVAAGVDEILLMALYPQHADSTRTTTVARVRSALTQHDRKVALRVLPPFHDCAAYLDVLAEHTRRHLPQDIQLLLVSYHGLPERHITRADPTHTHCLKVANCCETPSQAHATCYRHQAYATSAALAERLNLKPDQIATSFQSRLGRLPWLEPYTDVMLRELPRRGVTRIAVVAPAFVADNLETLEELDIRGREQFRAAGGESFTLLPCLNDDPAWVELLAEWSRQPLPESAVDQR
jgi:ferrochelatase